MNMEKAGPRPEPEGCLTVAIRIPIRIVVLVIVVPVRMVWDVLVVAARALDRTVLRPTGRALTWLGKALFVRPWVWLWRQLVLPAVHYGLVIPAVWLYGHVLTPLGRALATTARRLGMVLFVWPWVGLWRYVVVPVARYGFAVPAVWLYRELLTPLGHALVWFLTRLGWGLGMVLFVWPWVGLWRYVVVPVARYGIGVPAAWMYRWILTPIGAGLAFLALGLWRYVVVPVARYGVALPTIWLYRQVLTPLGHGLAWVFTGLGHGLAWAFTGIGRVLRWVGMAVFVWPWVAVWRYVVVPGVRYGVVVPLGWLWRRVLVPVGREVLDALRVCWRVAGFISRAVGRALKWAAWNLVGRPTAWVYRSVCTPLGHWVRDQVWAPARKAAVGAGRVAREALASARATVRQTRKDAWRALVGAPRMPEPREPVVAATRTLGSTTTASGAAPTPETSLRKPG
ncbi:hypothetical protein Q5762_18860 [Streptomyces sp. P9(2023)]|uniref:hypothetical protein n=1 Tax=Streptomyces sp. P9(2023) TaxID=3064394 RepID=UPI0028F40B54|nr:hypothetical protein [Streptomyces sp. P9(2023)]MDT9690362.1 hypothetical protein [Streptomyces sp. P9(2023)]